MVIGTGAGGETVTRVRYGAWSVTRSCRDVLLRGLREIECYGPAFSSTIAALRRRPASFARFIGNFWNAALNCA